MPIGATSIGWAGIGAASLGTTSVNDDALVQTEGYLRDENGDPLRDENGAFIREN